LLDVVAVQGDVELTERYGGVLELLDVALQTASERDAARTQADQDQGLDTVVALDELVGQPRQGAAHVVGAEQPFLARVGHGPHSFAASRDRA
jgi:hypothetical protein